MPDKNFWKGKKVFLTGHTGFKGSWMLVLLNILGVECTGYSLNPPTKPSLYEIIGGDKLCKSIIADIKDGDRLKQEIKDAKPDIVIHMAAQPLVIEGYKNPAETYYTNVLGTVNILEAVRLCGNIKAFINVTTDKVYENKEKVGGYIEDDRLGGYDPYSSSKACSELVTACYRNSFFNFVDNDCCGIATARAGNVLGGGDFAENRLVPDCVKAALKGEKIIIRNGKSVRPWQHVIEPLTYYLLIAQNIVTNGKKYCTSFNIGPDKNNCRTVMEILKIFCKEFGENLEFAETEPNLYHETSLLTLDNTKAKKMLGFSPCYDLSKTVKLIVEWTKAYRKGEDMFTVTKKQVEDYLNQITKRG